MCLGKALILRWQSALFESLNNSEKRESSGWVCVHVNTERHSWPRSEANRVNRCSLVPAEPW